MDHHADAEFDAKFIETDNYSNRLPENDFEAFLKSVQLFL